VPADPAVVKSLFLELAAVDDPAARAEQLRVRCGADADLLARVNALLAANDFVSAGGETATFPAAPGVPETTAYRPPAEQPGTLVAGRYKLLQPIGEGGMGSVWMADQTEPVRRRVAVKLIRADRGASRTILTRFEAERQAIALMNHPHVAKLLDAGTTDGGAPFFVMELVKGVPLTDYCDAHRLSVADRLALFRQICSAVHHAHMKGVIHRDLKPTNILVESHDGVPVPKVIDFGLAKATTGMQLTEHTLFTGFGSVMGTPAYMAPEQAAFNAVDVDTRADVYALGVILYELLTGTTPLTREALKMAALDEMLRLIREQDAPTPSSRLGSGEAKPAVAANRQTEPAKLGRFVKGELDWIVMMALAKERDRRYQTADGFARDIDRFLSHEPVQAGPPGTGYRLRKFARRNRLRVLVTGLLLAGLLVGVTGSTWGLVRAEAARVDAEAARGESAAALARVSEEQGNTREALARATTADAASRRILARQYVARGAELIEHGNRTDALAWFVAALAADAPDPAREQAHRTRIGTTARMCPRPDRIWFDAPGPLLQAGFVPGGQAVYAATETGAEVVVRVRDRATGGERFPAVRLAEAWSSPQPRSLYPRLGFSSDGRRFWTIRYTDFGPPEALASGAGSPRGGEVRVWDAATGRLLSTLPAGCGAPTFTPEGTRLLSVRKTGDGPGALSEAVVWEVDRGALAYPPLNLEGGVVRAHLAANGTRVVASSSMGGFVSHPRSRIRVWDAADGSPVTDELPGRLNGFGIGPEAAHFVRVIDLPAADAPDRREHQTWDLTTGRPLGPPRAIGGRTAYIGGAVSGGGGKRFLAEAPGKINPDAATDSTTLFDAATWQVIRDNLPGRAYFSPDGRRFLTASAQTAVLGNADTGAPVGTEVPLRDGLTELRFSPDGRRVLLFDGERSGQLWDAGTGTPIARDIRFPTADIGPDTPARPGGAFAPDGRHAAAWVGNQARVWDGSAEHPATPCLSHPAAVTAAEFSPDGFHLLTACADGSVRLWPVTAGEPPARHIDHYPHPLVGNISFHPGGSRLSAELPRIRAAGARPAVPGTVLIWDGDRTVPLPAAWTSVGETPFAVYQDAAGGRIACWTATSPRTGRIYNTATREQIGPDLVTETRIVKAGFSPDGATLWALSPAPPPPPPGPMPEYRFRLHLWDAASGLPRCPPLGPVRGAGPSANVVFVRNGTLVVAFDESAGVWEVATGRPAGGVFPDATKTISTIPGGRALVERADGGKLVWDTDTGRAVGPPLSRLHGTWDPAYTRFWTLEAAAPDGGRAAQPRDPRTGEPSGPPVRLPGGPLAWASGRTDSVRATSVTLLDQATGRPRGGTLRHADPIETITHSADGRLVATTSRNGRTERQYGVKRRGYLTSEGLHRSDVRVWDAATGELLGPPLPHLGRTDSGLGGDVNAVRFSPAGTAVLTCPTPDEVRLVDIVPDPRPAEVLARIAEGLSGRRLTAGWDFVPLDRTAYQAAWAELSSLLPAAPDPEYRPAGWHVAQARAYGRDGDDLAARFHGDQLDAGRPEKAGRPGP
jgi:WD40 repeat protein